MSDVPALPEGTRLLHIGPHKTGTTAVQAAFHHNRPRLQAQDVHYAGRTAHPMLAAMAAASGTRLPTEASPALHRWRALVEDVHAARAARTVISSEFFCEADDEHIRRILDDLGSDRTHVVVTLRPLSKLLASQWQQYVQNLMRTSYPEWLDAMLNRADTTKLTPSFWRRHRHDELVRRWAEVVGPDRLTVVAVDDSDRGMVMRTFEQLVALEPGTLVPREVSANRSLTYDEVELLRTFNRHYRAREWSHADYTRLVRFGAARYLQQRQPGPDEERLLTPRWAVDRAVEIAATAVAGIEATGVRVVGDLSSLTAPLEERAVGENEPRGDVSVEVASRFIAGLLDSTGRIPDRRTPPRRETGPMERRLRASHAADRLQREVDRLTAELDRLPEDAPGYAHLGAGELSAELARRVARRLSRGLRR